MSHRSFKKVTTLNIVWRKIQMIRKLDKFSTKELKKLKQLYLKIKSRLQGISTWIDHKTGQTYNYIIKLNSSRYSINKQNRKILLQQMISFCTKKGITHRMMSTMGRKKLLNNYRNNSYRVDNLI